MNKWKLLNFIKMLPIYVIYMLALPIVFPFVALIIFFVTNWEDESDRRHSINALKKAFKPWQP